MCNFSNFGFFDAEATFAFQKNITFFGTQKESQRHPKLPNQSDRVGNYVQFFKFWLFDAERPKRNPAFQKKYHLFWIFLTSNKKQP